MTYFLTSSTVIPGTDDLNPANHFIDELKKHLPDKPLKGLFICSSPDAVGKNEKYGNLERTTLEAAGFCFSDYQILDRRNESRAAGLLTAADIVILAGGHVPTQNKFFSEIKLKKLIKNCKGVIVGISAGTMNAAETVYAHPEREGEATSKDFKKFIPGLGLTKAMVLPHYNEIKDDVLDGLRVFEDIAYPDSMGRKFYVLVDGSYIFGADSKEELRGQAYLIQDGAIKRLNDENQIISLE